MEASPKLGRCLFAALLLVVGVQHFLYAKFVSTLVPAWIPFRLFWAYFVGVAFFTAAIALTLNVLARLAGILLGVLFLIFVATTHIPRIVLRSGSGNEWTSGFVALAVCGGAWLLSSLRPIEERRKEGDSLLSLGYCCFGAAMVGFGVLHFFDPGRSIRVGPPWIALPAPWGWVTGGLLATSGALILLRRKVEWVGWALSCGLALFFVGIYVPQLVATPHNPAPWTSGFEMLGLAGSALAITSRARLAADR
jgi:uncharacterized membrane protein